MVALWLPACLVDRFENAVEDVTICIWDPALNKEFVFVIAIVGHHGCFIMIVACYARVFYVLKNKLKANRKIRPCPVSVYNISQTPGATTTHQFIPQSMDETNSKESHRNKKTDCLKNSNERTTLSDINEDDTETLNHSTKRERRAFITLTYIIVGYAICWFPFHIVFDIMAIKPEIVPHSVYQVTFWLTYVNSTINPFLYNFSNPEFRKAFKKVLMCR